MQGEILGNRYELIEKIGGGGMANVYKAKCRLLNRYVAVKILRPEFTNDEEFVKRFLIEAQSVASLSHPNIVSIYDVGHENNLHYIVMEYVKGITLKNYISKKGSLTWRDTINIGVQICSAIEHAHRNHIVHRDIKPHNILLTENGVAKVTDFGIARAASSATITMAGSTIGSVHYFSPEQARGGYIGEKSDIYSLGVTIYEMITGRMPFDGETPVAVALKHIQEIPIAPKEINAAIPNAINDVVMKSMSKEQDMRYQTVSDMLQDLYRSVEEPEGDFVMTEDVIGSPTRRVMTLKDDSVIGRDNNDMKPKPKGKNDKKTIWLAVGTSVVVIVTFIIMTILLLSPNTDGSKKTSIDINNYVGRNIDEVKKELQDKKLNVKTTIKNDDKLDKDIIISQSIEQGKTLKPGGYIEFNVSAGSKEVKVPDVSKKEYRVANAQLIDLGLSPKVEDEFHDTIPEGFVTKTDPTSGTMLKEKSDIIVYRSKGPELKEIKVPKLIGLTINDAQNEIIKSGLTVGKIAPDNLLAGKVILQDPAEGATVKEKSAVNLTISNNTSATPTLAPNRTLMPLKLSWDSSATTGDRVQVRVEATPKDTNKTEIIFNEFKSKTDFPFSIMVPVPNKESTSVKIYYDNKQVSSTNLP